MGMISEKFNQRLQSFQDMKVVPLAALREARAFVKEANLPSSDELSRLDGLHAAYVHVLNTMIALFEQFCGMPELEPFYQILEQAQDEYMPGGPPMSPLYLSHFSCWAFCDLQVGRGKETMASVLFGASKVAPMEKVFLHYLKNLCDSRMGLYRYQSAKGSLIELEELLTNKSLTVTSPLSYRGRPGELWFVRLLPSARPEREPSLVFTTPYVIQQTEEKDWLAYLERTLSKIRLKDKSLAYHRLFKYGRSRHYWNEFIFEAYFSHEAEACYLKGVPDIDLSRPHSRASENIRDTITGKNAISFPPTDIPI
jgi:hypothetical protein